MKSAYKTAASPSRSRVAVTRSSKPKKEDSSKKAEQDFLASVMVSVSASLEAMSEEERERAVKAAEKSVAHL